MLDYVTRRSEKLGFQPKKKKRERRILPNITAKLFVFGFIGDKVCDEEQRMTNDDNLESNLLTSSLLKRHLVYMLVQDELNNREQVIHHFKLIMQREDNSDSYSLLF